MSRIEKGSDTKSELQEIKGEVIKEISAQGKGRPWLSCSLGCLLLLLIFVFAVTWGVGATGLVYVPAISRFAYHTPVPERIVSPGVPADKIIDKQVKSILAERLQAGAGVLENRSLKMTITEQSLTASLRLILEQGGDEIFDVDRTQVTVNPKTGLSFFLPLAKKSNGTALSISVVATLANGVVELQPQSFRVGALGVPNVLTAFFLRPFIHDKISAFNKVLGSYVEIDAIEYEQESVTVSGRLAVTIEKAL